MIVLMRYTLLLLISLLLSTNALAQESVTVTLTVTSSYDQTPVADATARLLLDGQIKAEAQTGADGTAVLNWSSVNIPNGHEIPSDFAITALYPNPVSSQATVEVASRHERAVTVGIYDVLGRQVASRSINLTEGISRVPLQAGLAYGVYFVRFSGPGIDHTRSFLSTGRQGAVMVGAPQWIGSLEQRDATAQTPAPFGSGQWEVTVEKNGFEPYAALIDPDNGTELEIELQAILATVFVQNNDSRDVPAGNIAYLVVGADSLFSSSGVFEGIPVGSTVKAGFKNAVGQYTSFVRTAAVELDNSVLAQGSESGFYVRPFDFYLRDENYVVVDSLSRTGGELVENVVGFRNWIDHLWLGDGGNGVTRWNINPNIQGSDPNTFNFFTQSENGRGPESLIIPDIFYVENTDFSHYLDEHVKNLMINTVENHIFPYMGFNGVFAPPIVQPDSISFLATNNQYKNHMILAPRNNFPPGVFGSIAVYGEAPNNIYSTSARIRSPPSPNDHTMIRAISQEMMAAAIMNRIPANPASLPEALAEHYQSILHNSTSLVTPSMYDIKLLRFVWEPTYVGAVTDVIELPPGVE